MSDTDLVDSISPNGSPASIPSPTSGSSTNTISPRASAAKWVMPTRTTSPSVMSVVLTHSCSSDYRQSVGKAVMVAPHDHLQKLQACHGPTRQSPPHEQQQTGLPTPPPAH